MPETVYDVLARAIRQKSKVRIRYQRSHGDDTEIVISPFAWSGLSYVRAHCAPDGQERAFDVHNIVKCVLLADEQSSTSSSLSAGRSSASAPSAAPQTAVPPPVPPTSAGTPGEPRTTPATQAAAPDRPPEKSRRSLDYEDFYVGYSTPTYSPPRQARTSPSEPSDPTPAVAFRTVPHVAYQSQAAVSVAGPPFTQVKSAAEWTRLVDYYRDCLIIENRQQYIVSESDILSLHTTSAEEALGFLQGQTVLEVPRARAKNRTREEDFIARRADEKLKQLCLGYPLLVWRDDKRAPLLYCPVEITEQPEKYVLHAEDFEVSYAALHALKLGDEEIAGFLSAIAQTDTGQEREPSSAFLDRIITQLSDLLAFKLEFGQTRAPFTLLPSPGLFWVNAGIATQNLIKELEQLSQPTYWSQAPVGLRTLLSLTPDHEYPQAPMLEEDPTFYVSTVNASQVLAVTAARTEPLTVITGPPGTGKSELVLNIIADASFAGQKTLFASRINAAVDVVMNRLQNELAYPGAIRSGSEDYRRQAAQQMERALNESGTHARAAVSVKARESYAQARKAAVDAHKQLTQIKELSGLLESQCRERDDWRQRLRGPAAKLAAQRMPSYVAVEVRQFQDAIADLRRQLWSLQHRERELAAELQQLIVEDSTREPVVQQLKRFENQWGPFGKDFLAGAEAKDALKIAEHVQTWLRLAPALDARLQEEKARRECEQAKRAFEQETSGVAQHWREVISAAAHQHSASELATLEAAFEQLALQFAQIAEHRPSFWERLAVRLRLKNPMRSALPTYRQWVHRMATSGAETTVNEPPDAAALAEECHQRASVARAAQALQRRAAAGQTLEDCRERCTSTALALPEAMSNDLARLEQTPSVSPSFRVALTALLTRAGELQRDIDALAMRVNDLIDGNSAGLAMLQQFRQASGEKDPHLWTLSLPSATTKIDRRLNEWHALASLWTAEAQVKELERKLSALPFEAEAVKRLDDSQSTMLRLSREVLRESWFERATRLSNREMQEIRDHAEALNILGRPHDGGPRDPTTYANAKRTVENCFCSALGLFGSWATTNLSARSNFPLVSGLFDLLIIDEASQCDIASALPLLYRAKRVVIIGDPNQLKHVATITESADVRAAARHGIAREPFGFRGQSLYDLAERSIGAHPGPRWLDEHYRSDARIIAFSNEQFYRGKLQVRTDLTRHGFPRSFLNDCGGITWWHVPGTTRRPSKGSAYNSEEISAIRELLPQLIKSIKPYGLGERDVGIVTPFRDQANRIQKLCETSGGGAGAVRVGTAHVFQGDERHVMILSPVLSTGIPEGTLRWLNETANLLNVAVTRARIAVIVIGDWEFCQRLPTNNIYRKLANYVAACSNRVVRKAEEIPLLGGPPFPIVGQIIDPHNPGHNRTTLRLFLSACRDYVWWLDSYFNNTIIDLLAEVFDGADCRLREVHLLTDTSVTEAAEGRKPQLDPKGIEDLAASLASRGVFLEARALPKKELGVHDRLLFSPGQAINMPPFAAAIGQHHYLSEYTASSISPTVFVELWDKARRVGTA